MSKPVHVLHPYPVRYVPRGARKERFAFARGTVPVALNEADPGDIDHLVTLGGDREPTLSLHAHAGRLWMLAADDADEFLGFLRGENLMEADPSGVLAPALRGTPLWARFETARSADGPLLYGDAIPLSQLYAMTSRGRGVDLSAARRVVLDGAARAARDVARFLDGNVVLAGGKVFLRLPGPLVDVRFAQQELVAFPRSFWEFAFLQRADRALAMPNVLDISAPRTLGPVALAVLDAVDPALMGEDDDLDLVVNRLPRLILRHLGDLAPDALGAEGEDLARRMEAMRSWLVLGMTGSIAEEEREDAAAQALGLMREALRVYPFPGHIRTFPAMARFVEEVVLPRLRPPMADADLASLSGLGP